MNAHDVAELFELVASAGRPGLLEPVAAFLCRCSSDAVRLAAAWQVEPCELAAMARRAVENVDGLERRRLQPEDVEPGAISATIDAAGARAGRMESRGRQLESIIRALEARAGAAA